MKATLGEITRWNQIGVILASKLPEILHAMLSLLDTLLDLIEAREGAMPGTPNFLISPKLLLHAARVHGITVFTGRLIPNSALHAPAILLTTIPWLDLTDPGIREQLLELHRRGEIKLVSVGPGIIDLARSDLVSRGEPPELIEQSAIVDGATTYHALLV